MELWVIRLPFLLSSLVGILAMIWLTYQILRQADFSLEKARWYSLLAGGLMVFSPWHVHYSRAGFESGMALSLVLLGMAFFYYWLSHKKWIWGGLAVTGLVAALYTYHSAKIFLPVFGLSLLAIHYRMLVARWKQVISYGLLALVLLVPLGYDSFFRAGAQRAQQTTILFSQASASEKAFTIGQNFLQHLTPQFLLMGQTTTFRHGDGVWGVLLPLTLLLVAVGIFSRAYRKISLFGLLWVVAGLLAPAVGFEIPHSNRALLALPGFLWLAVVGFLTIGDWIKQTKANREIQGSHGEKNMVYKTFVGGFILLQAVFFTSYIHHYFNVFPADSGADFKEGYLEALEFVLPHEYGADGKTEAEKIIFTSQYGQPYIYTLIARETDPYEYHGGSLIKYEFKDVEIGDLNRANAVVVAAGDDELPTERADKIIYGADGQIRFQIFVTK
jgi:hypothetical protein